MATPTPPTDVPQSLNFSIQPGPDGSPWIGIHFVSGTVHAMMLLPISFVDTMPEQLRATAEEARKQAKVQNKGGLITPDTATISAINRHKH